MMTRREHVGRILSIKISELSIQGLLGIIVALITIAGSVAAAARAVVPDTRTLATKAGVESVYVRRDSLALRLQRDSLNLKATVDAMQKDIQTLVHACQNKGDCPR